MDRSPRPENTESKRKMIRPYRRLLPFAIGIALFLIAGFVLWQLRQTPAESMPPALTQMMTLSPLRYYVDFAMAVLFRDAGPVGVLRELLIMAGIGAAFFILALIRFRTHFGLVGK